MSSTGEDEPMLLHSEVTEDQVHDALRVDIGDVAQLLSWETENFTKKGDNYIGVVNSLRVKYLFEDKESEKSYVIKIIPHHQLKAYRDITQMAFHKEAQFYSELAPALSDQLIKIGHKPLRIPFCYYTNLESKREVIILEDLRHRGFKMHDRRKGMDAAHINLVLQEVARLHASSILLQATSEHGDLGTVYDFIKKDWINLNEESKEFATELFRGCIDNAVAILNKVGGYEKAVAWLDELKPHIYEKVKQQLKRCPPFTVVCHGDCWNNNTLFRYNKDGSPEEVMLLDLQLTRMASLATDLNYLTFASLEGPDRRNNIDSFLNTYYKTYKDILEAGGLKVPFSFADLQEEYKAKHLYGLISSLEIVPIVVSEGSEVPDYSNISEGGMDSFVKKQQDNMLQMIERNSLLRPRFLALFDEMMDHAIIQ